ncbi:unnamed protein product, partial [Trichobilharzia regenti]
LQRNSSIKSKHRITVKRRSEIFHSIPASIQKQLSKTSKVKPLGVNNKTLSRYFDKMLDTLINKTENKKMLEETVSTPNENGSESQSPKEQGHEETGNENGVGVLSGSGTTNGVDKQITIDPISTGLITNNDHDVTLTMSPPLSLGDEVNSPGLAASTDDLLSLDQYDPYEQRTKNLSVNESLASSCLNIISQNQDGSERTRNDSTLERWLSQSELLKPVTKLKVSLMKHLSQIYVWLVGK